MVINIYKDFKEEFLTLAGSYSLLNDKMHAALFLSGVGAAIHKRGIFIRNVGTYDMRIHELIIQQARSGKGESLNVFEDFVKALRLSIAKELQFTDAGIVGRIDGDCLKINEKGGFIPGDPDFKDPVIMGDLGYYDIIAFTEAKQMIKTGTHTEDKLEILQTVMDTPKAGSNNVRKKLSDAIPLSYTSNSTIIGTTYYLKEFEEILLKQGLFQRLYTIVRDVSLDDRAKIHRGMVYPSESAVPHSEYLPRMNKLAQDILRCIEKYNPDEYLEFNNHGRDALMIAEAQRMEFVKKNISGNELEVMEPFLTAMMSMHMKIAGIHAILNGSKHISPNDVAEANQEMTAYLSSIVDNIMTRISGVNPDAVKKLILMQLKMKDKIELDDITLLMIDHFYVSEKRAKVMIKDLIKNKTINEKNGYITKR